MINKYIISISVFIILAACTNSPTISLPTARVKEIQETNEANQHENYSTRTITHNYYPPGTSVNDAPLSYLLVGDKPSLIVETPNKLRSNPGLDGDKMGKIHPGEQLLVLDELECSDGYVWWYVLNLVSGFPGWTAEGDQTETWFKLNGQMMIARVRDNP
jgi:hypothetical protein